MYSLRYAACRLVVSPARLPIRSRLTTIPSAYRLATPRRTFIQTRWFREEGKNPVSSDSKDEAATTTNTSTTTTEATDATTSTSTTTTETVVNDTRDETVKVETHEVEQKVGVEGSEAGIDTTFTTTESHHTAKPGVEVEEKEVEQVQLSEQKSDTADVAPFTEIDDTPPNPLVDDETEIVQEIANPPSEGTNPVPISYSSDAPVAPSLQVGEETAQTPIHPRSNMTEPAIDEYEDGFDLSQIREAASEQGELSPDEQKRLSLQERLALRQRAQLEPKDTIFIGNLFYDVTAEDLRERMAKYGIVQGVNIIYDSRGISKGYAYVQFDGKEAAARAINAMHMRIYEGRRVTVHYAQTRMNRDERPKEPTDTLYIANLPFEMTDRDLQDLFKDIVGATDIRVTVDRQTGLLLGYIHAEFLNVQSAMVAREKLFGKSIYNKRLFVDYSTSMKKLRSDFPVAV
ncbi:hypothetical protein BDV06DRAFT_189011 [Aspergillus oleicola]